MNDLTRKQLRQPVEFVPDDDPAGHFLPLAVRRVLYVAALVGAVGAPILAVTHPEYAAAVVTGAGILNAAALGTALANPSR